MTDPDNALAERRIGGGSDGDAEDDHRMMASTTVFVIEPGFTAVGKVYFFFICLIFKFFLKVVTLSFTPEINAVIYIFSDG